MGRFRTACAAPENLGTLHSCGGVAIYDDSRERTWTKLVTRAVIGVLVTFLAVLAFGVFVWPASHLVRVQPDPHSATPCAAPPLGTPGHPGADLVVREPSNGNVSVAMVVGQRLHVELPAGAWPPGPASSNPSVLHVAASPSRYCDGSLDVVFVATLPGQATVTGDRATVTAATWRLTVTVTSAGGPGGT